MMFIIITLTSYLYNRLVLMGLGPRPTPLDHPDALLRRRYLRPYLSPARSYPLHEALSSARYRVM